MGFFFPARLRDCASSMDSPIPKGTALECTLLRRQIALARIARRVRHQRICEPRNTHLGDYRGPVAPRDEELERRRRVVLFAKSGSDEVHLFVCQDGCERNTNNKRSVMLPGWRDMPFLSLAVVASQLSRCVVEVGSVLRKIKLDQALRAPNLADGRHLCALIPAGKSCGWAIWTMLWRLPAIV